MQKFVILSAHRSGTSMVAGTLNEHPKIICHGELFHPEATKHIRWSTGFPRPVFELRTSDPFAYLEGVFAHRPNGEAVGFKMHRGQQREVCVALAKDPSVGKIILERENVLARYSSDQLAKRNKVWNQRKATDKEIDRAPLAEFDPDDFLAAAFRHRRTFAWYGGNVKEPFLKISYEEILADGFGRIQEFLGVEPMDLTPGTRRLHSNNILERFEPGLHEAIRGTLESIGKREWESEMAGSR